MGRLHPKVQGSAGGKKIEKKIEWDADRYTTAFPILSAG